jgi:hypothetical protein
MRKLLSSAVLAALLLVTAARAGAIEPTKEPVSPDGSVRAVADLPASQHLRNTGGMGFRGPGTGAGLCVFTAIELAGRWQNIAALAGLQKYMTTREGGGWPQKVDQVLVAYCKERGTPVPAYIQHTGGDEALLKLALGTDRIVCVTYAGRDDFYSGRIAHMVNLLYLDDAHACILDNNRPGAFVWMTRTEFLSRWRDMQGGWAIVFLAPPPPPYPTDEHRAGAGCVCGSECACKAGTCPNKCPTVVGQRCPDGRCPVPAPVPVFPRDPAPAVPAPAGPAPIGAPPSDEYEWGICCSGVWGWRFKPKGADAPTGVDSTRIAEAPEYAINGMPVSPEYAHRRLAAGGSLPNDSDRWHLTAVGDADFLKRVAADLDALPADVRGKLLFQSYPSDHWAVSQFKLPAGLNLRKPSPVRTSADVGTVPPGEYEPRRLVELLGLPGGPLWKPAPPALPKPPVVPIPVPIPVPVPAPAPDSGGSPAPAGPKPDQNAWLTAAILGLLWLVNRYFPPKPAAK